MTESRWTSAVFSNLHKKHPDHEHTVVYEVMPYESLDSFTARAKSWLGNRSELKTRTIERADWPSIYKYFKGMMEKD